MAVVDFNTKAPVEIDVVAIQKVIQRNYVMYMDE